MKIKLAILDTDQSYLSRISSVLGTKFAEKLEIYSFTDEKMTLEVLTQSKFDVLIASDNFDIDTSKIPKRCGFAYFVDSPGIESVREQRAICKFQKGELIYKEVLGLYSENVADITSISIENNNSRVITFTGASGGTGISAVAAACAIYLAKRGKNVLYLNMELCGSANAIFSAPGQFDFSDVIYAVKSKKSNLSLKLESTVKQDATGVFFYDPCRIALDMTEITNEDIRTLINHLGLVGTYHYILIDTGFRFDKVFIEFMKLSSRIVLVSDGSEISDMKLSRAYAALATYEQQQDIHLLSKLALVYNKFSNKTGIACEIEGINILGGAPRLEHATYSQVVDMLLNKEFLEKIVDR